MWNNAIKVGLAFLLPALLVVATIWHFLPRVPQPGPDRHPGLPAWIVLAFKNAEQIELLSLDPAKPVVDPDSFHHWRVFGTTRLDNADDRRAVTDALMADYGRGGGFMCFDPRHGVRLTGPAGTVDLVICFECGNVEVHGANGGRGYTTGATAEPVLDRILTAAGVTLAPKSRQQASSPGR